MVEDGESQWRNLERKFREIGEDGVRSFASRMTQGIFVLSIIMIEQEQFCALPRTEWCDAKVGRDSH